MKTQVIVDTGPLVALLLQREQHHHWVMQQLQHIQPPLLTCEAVLTEAAFLLRQSVQARNAVLEMLTEGFLQIALQVTEQSKSLLHLSQRYASVPMSLADACLVRLAELHHNSPVFTLDSDFHIYRKNTRHAIALIAPY